MDKLKHNWQWKIASLIIGFFLWVYITAGINPTQSTTLDGLKVDLTNQNSLSQRNLVVTSIEPASLSAKITGKRNDLSRMKADGLQLSLDASQLEEGTQSVRVKVSVPNNVYVDEMSANQVTVKVEKIISRTIDVVVEDVGTLADNYILESITPTPASVEVRGPSSELEKIHHFHARLDVSHITDSTSSNVSIVPVDEEGEEITGIQANISSVNIAVSVLKQAEVPIKAQFTGHLPYNKKMTKTQMTPNTVIVKGKPSLVDQLTEVVTVPIDLTELSQSGSLHVKLSYPDGIEPVAEDTDLTFSYEILPLSPLPGDTITP